MTQPTAPPQYSPDGRFWWDGVAWQPVPQAVPASVAAAAPITATSPRNPTLVAASTSGFGGPVAIGGAGVVFMLIGGSVLSDPDLHGVGSFLMFLGIALMIGAGIGLARVFRTKCCSQCRQRIISSARVCSGCHSAIA